MYLAETETNEIKKIVQIRVYLTGKDQAAAQPWQQIESQLVVLNVELGFLRKAI